MSDPKFGDNEQPRPGAITPRAICPKISLAVGPLIVGLRGIGC